MAKRPIAILALLMFLPLAAGATPFLHHHTDQESAASCQTCYLIKIGSVGLAISFALLLVATQPSRPFLRPVDFFARGSVHHAPAAPRAPPAR
jgi:hypothetical protein